ncbi:MAG: MBL fold metallo-hydrolase [Clostridiales bacterium]|nr:MBL fold metallo-hydrolase [Clostridiales bacterium]
MAKKLTKKQKKAIVKTARNHWKVLVVLAIVLVLFVTLAYFMGWIDILKDKLFPQDDGPASLSEAGGHVTTLDTVSDLEIGFVDVGQGDCIIIKLPDNKTMIIDSGDKVNAAKDSIEEYIQDNNIKAFDYMLLTHQDADHVANLDWVLENYQVRYIFRPNIYSDNALSASIPAEFNPELPDKDNRCTTNVYAEFIVAAYNESCTTEIFNKDSDFTNKVICGEQEYSYTFNFLTPVAEKSEISYSDANDYSPIFTLDYAGRKIMFNGDAEEKMLKEYVQNYPQGHNVDVLKVGHHGSHNATSEEFINLIDPEVAVIQCGYGNDHGHPHGKTLTILENYDSNMKVYRNDNNGNIKLTINASGDMVWDFENDDMSKNDLSGYELSGEGEIHLYASKIIPDTVLQLLQTHVVFDNRKELII